MNNVIFIDTNILIHFKFLTEIKWHELINEQNVVLVFNIAIIKELDQLKYDSIKRTRERARKVIKKLDQLFDNENHIATLNDNTKVYLFIDESLDSIIKENNLDPTNNDHAIIASVLNYSKHFPEDNIWILSNDFGLRLAAKKFSLKAIAPNIEIESDQIKDDNSKRIAELQNKIKVLENRLPNVIIGFEDGEILREFSIIKPEGEDNQNAIKTAIEEVKLKHPKKNYTPIANQILPPTLFRSSEQFITKYNDELDEYYKKYEQHLKYKNKIKNLNNIGILLELEVYNIGYVPAENTEFFLHFPDGFDLFKKNEINNLLTPPNPPKLENEFSDLYNSSLLSGHLANMSRFSTTPPNLSSLNIKRTNSFDVNFEIRTLKHNQGLSLEPLYILFDSFQTAKSFSIDFRIQADNMPLENKGELNIVINKT